MRMMMSDITCRSKEAEMERDNIHIDDTHDTHVNGALEAVVALAVIEHASALTISSHSLVDGNVTISIYLYGAYRGPGAS